MDPEEKENTSKVAGLIEEMRKELKEAINKLEIKFKNNDKKESLLDFAILMALQSMELMFYKRAIECIPPFSLTRERDLNNNEWDNLEPDQDLVKLLDQMGNL